MSSKKIQYIIKDFLAQPLPILDTFREKLFLIVFCGTFATFFLFYYNPMNANHWQHDSPIGSFLTVWSAGILGAIVLAISQFLLRPKFNLMTFNVGQFSLWLILEFWLLSLLFFFLFREKKVPLFEEYFFVLQSTVSIAIIPYALACLLLAVRKLSRQPPTSTLPIIQQVPPAPLAQYSFKDENGKIMLAINLKQLLCLKSESNYIAIFFLQNEKVEKKLIRSNLKKLSNELKVFPNLLRVHRSYMVNLENIASVQRKKGSYQIELNKLPDMPLTVSEKYKQFFEAQIAN